MKVRRTGGIGKVTMASVCCARLLGGCGDGFIVCEENRTCAPAPEDGVAAGAPTDGLAGANHSGGSTNEAGEPSGDGGSTRDPAAPSGGEGGTTATVGSNDGGGGGAAPSPTCPDGYSDWFTSSFSFPDGDVLGTADFPSMPWASSGSLKIDTGKLSGTGTAIVSQGAAFPYAGSRLRFRVRFTDAKQQITAAFDAAKDGSGGIRILLDATGSLSLTEGKTSVAATDLPPLETGVDWFVEAMFDGTSAAISLSQKNYGSEPQAAIATTLDTDALKVTAAGVKTAMALASDGGLSPSLDELSFSRCGVAPPDYMALLVDDFERADSTTLGKAQVPANATWQGSSTSARVVAGSLQVQGLSSATIPVKVTTNGMRLRTSLSMPAAASPYLWADVNYNVTAAGYGASLPGFWMWGGPSDDFFNTGIFVGAHGETSHKGVTLAVATPYFVELDRDGDIAVLTVRSTSFSGPFLAVEANTGLLAQPDPGTYFTLGDEGGSGARFDEIRVESYQVP